MRRLGSLIEKTVDASGTLSGWLVPVMMVLVAVEVFMRYVMGRPLIIADEVSAYMLVVLSYLGLAYTWKQEGHVRIGIVVNQLPPRAAGWVRFVGLLLVLAFMIEMTRAGYKMAVYALKINLRSSTWLMVPLFWPQVTVFIGFILLTLLLAVEVVRSARKLGSGEKAGKIQK